ncbi:MAG: hypothetical protein OIF56_06960 [Cohaesibacter sp.]|nr:hypothetical protein [Cohaesibacter sp.]MCV6603070.1 hypothetical protein [Cohaesibacter sp.]
MIGYILFHLESLWAFVRGNREALYGIDVSRQGLIRSFLAMVIVESVSLVYAFGFGTIENSLIMRQGGLAYLPLQLFLDWGTVPLAFLLLSGPMGFRDRLIPLIVSYNWMSVIVLLLILLPSAMVTGGVISGEMVLIVMIGVYGTALWLTYRLLDFILDQGMSVALGLTVLTMILGIASASILSEIAQGLPLIDSPDIGGSRQS